MSLLEMKDICKSFFGKKVLDCVDLSVEEGEIHALLGENGAGKTTLMNILFGLYHADDGHISWQGKRQTFSEPIDAISAGIGMVHQHFALVPTMSVQQNISLGLKSDGYPFIDRKSISDKIQTIAQKYDLDISLQSIVGFLSLGEQQKVEILRALYRKAKLLILDEPTAVLTPSETENFFKTLERLKKEGHSVIFITHRMSEILRASDRVTILRNGKKVATLHTKEATPELLANLMIGKKLSQPIKREKTEQTQEVLRLSNVTQLKENIYTLKDINLSLKKGQILGIAGVDGNGQKELAESILGIQTITSGDIYFKGQKINHKKVNQIRESGVAYVPSDRHNDGLALDLSLTSNLMLNQYKHEPFSALGFVKWELAEQYVNKAVDNYNIKISGMKQPVRLLSGGNQQKIILAREIGSQPELLVVCQPTRGLDIGATEQVRNLLIKERNLGRSILLISSDLEEILALSDQISVIFRGELMGLLSKEDGFDVELIGLMMGGKALVKAKST